MKDCPNKRTFIVREDGEYSSASDLDEDTRAMLVTNNAGDTKEHDAGEIHINADMTDQYPSLVTMRVFSAQVGHDELPQRHNLFQTKFVVKGHSVRVIIDGGSCNNLASTEMVEKLCLTITRHPHPYYIQWFNECGKLKVTRRVRVHFTLGSYHDYVDCDVVPMQACSLLLGRPRQYDNSVTHHGRTNSYTLVFNGKTINLLPMTPNEIINDGKDKTTERTTHSMLTLNSEFMLSVPTSDRDIPSNVGCHKLDLTYVHDVVHFSYSDFVHAILEHVMLPYEKIFHDINNGVITTLSHTHKLTPLKGHISVAPIFALLYDGFQVDERRGRLCFEEREDDEDIPTMGTPELNVQVLLFLRESDSTNQNMILPSCDIFSVLRNEGSEGWTGKKYTQMKDVEASSRSSRICNKYACMRIIKLRRWAGRS